MPSLLNRLILKGSVNNWINQWVWHPKEEDARLKVLAQRFINIREHKNEHHCIVRKPTYDNCIHDAENEKEENDLLQFIFHARENSIKLTSHYNHNRYPQRSHFRLVNQFLSIWITPSHVIEMRACRRMTGFEFEHTLATYFTRFIIFYFKAMMDKIERRLNENPAYSISSGTLRCSSM